MWSHLTSLSYQVCPALAMGNVVVLKPASYTRLTALLFAEICAEAGLPAGVFNVVTGPGSFGQALATHPLVDKVGFTGKGENGNGVNSHTYAMDVHTCIIHSKTHTMHSQCIPHMYMYEHMCTYTSC